MFFIFSWVKTIIHNIQINLNRYFDWSLWHPFKPIYSFHKLTTTETLRFKSVSGAFQNDILFIYGQAFESTVRLNRTKYTFIKKNLKILPQNDFVFFFYLVELHNPIFAWIIHESIVSEFIRLKEHYWINATFLFLRYLRNVKLKLL